MSSSDLNQEDEKSGTVQFGREEPQLGTVLVIGGCGFLGHHVVKFLLAEPTCTSVAVMSRSPFINRFEGVAYHIGDITIPEHVKHVINQVRPKVIINTASPHAYIDHEHAIENFRVNVDGNQSLLDEAVNVGTVKAFVYTSSGPIIAGKGGAYDHADETFPTLAGSRKGDPYHIAKAMGDKLTLDANGKNGTFVQVSFIFTSVDSPFLLGILTACIRPTALYGEGDTQMVGPIVKVLEDGQTHIWMGYNDVDMDVVYVGHVAKAEVLAALGLLRRHIDPTAPKIDGEAFNITDDEPAPPWTFFRKYWILAGDKTSLSSIWMIPPFIVMLMAHIAEVSS
jgi:sterol-4alpha-carboxylate 3-dehydrogenase (decarboxylating)